MNDITIHSSKCGESKHGEGFGVFACAVAFMLFAVLFACNPASAFADDQADAALPQPALAGDSQPSGGASAGASPVDAPSSTDAEGAGALADGLDAGSQEGESAGDGVLPDEPANGQGKAVDAPESSSEGDADSSDPGKQPAKPGDVAAGNASSFSEPEAAADEEKSGQKAALGPSGSSAVSSAAEADRASVSYEAHSQNVGWQKAVSDGSAAGRGGLQLEALRIKVDSNVEGGVSYSVHVANIGWMKAVSNGATAGTTGRSLHIEALKVKLTGALASLYDVFYRVKVADAGWMQWASNDAVSGSTGFARQVEQVQLQLLRKGSNAPSSNDAAIPATYVSPARVSVQAHVQNVGWQKAVGNGSVAGTTGRSLRAEAFRIDLTGALSDCYDVFYRVHSQNYGWLGWCYDNEIAGTIGQGLRAEAVQVYVTLKGGTAPDGYTRKANGTYIYLDAGHGWSGRYGYDVGAVGSGYKEAEQTKELVNKVASYARGLYNLKVYDNTTAGRSGVNFSDRQDDARSRGCTAFVSIHFNATGNGLGTGSESYASQRYGASGSKQLQSIMHNALVKGLGLRDRGMKDYGFSVCCGSVPSTLLEVCFIDNRNDMRMYKAREDYLARQLAAGLYRAAKAGF